MAANVAIDLRLKLRYIVKMILIVLFRPLLKIFLVDTECLWGIYIIKLKEIKNKD